MGRQSVSVPAVRGVDWKAVGYLTSIVSVFLLGAVAWPKPGEPPWHMAVLLGGMATSIVGMGFRYFAHRQEQAELRRAEADALEAKDRQAGAGR